MFYLVYVLPQSWLKLHSFQKVNIYCIMFQCAFVGRSYIDLYIEELIVLALVAHILKALMGEKSHE